MHNAIINFICVTIQLWWCSPILAYVPTPEINALEQFYERLHGEYWTWSDDTSSPRWNFDQPSPNPCSENGESWQGITCDKLPSLCASSFVSCSITFLRLGYYNLQGARY